MVLLSKLPFNMIIVATAKLSHLFLHIEKERRLSFKIGIHTVHAPLVLNDFATESILFSLKQYFY